MSKSNHSTTGNQSNNPSEEERETGLSRKTIKTFLISLVIVVVSSSTADILLKYSMSGKRVPSIHSFSDIPQTLLSLVTNVWLIVAIVLIIIQFITFSNALRLGPLSVVVPVRGACTLVATALLADIFLHERVTPERWAAIVVILIGVVMIGISERKS